jgi:hypothetical protein
VDNIFGAQGVGVEMTCGVLLVTGMGCRSSKHNNSVGDDNSNADTHPDNYQAHLQNGCVDEQSDRNKKMEQKKTTARLPPKDLKGVHRGPAVNKNERPFTQSQVDFFEMLDKKINAGSDYISEKDLSKIR